MKYCTKCGNKIKETDKFCTKCGSPTRVELERRRKESKKIAEYNKDKTLLYLGSCLIILASIIFAFTNWSSMSNIFKIGFLSIMMIIFLSLSFFSKKVSDKLPYKTTWFLGILFIPIILNLIAKYGMLGNYLSYMGAGIYVYLAICCIICFVIYFLSYKYINSNIFVYISYAFLYFALTFLLYAINRDGINLLDINIPILCIFNFMLVMLLPKISTKYKNTLSKFTSFVLFVFTFVLLIYSQEYDSYNINMIVMVITNLIHITTILMFMKNYKSGLYYTYPYILYLLVNTVLMVTFNNNDNLYIYMNTLFSILLYFIFYLYKDKTITISSFILMIVNILFLLLINESNKVLLVISLLLLVTSIFIYKTHNHYFIKNTCKFLIPISMVLTIISLCNFIFNINYDIIFLISSIVSYCIFTILIDKFNSKKISSLFEYCAYICLAFSSLYILINGGSIITFIINELLWLYYFVFKTIYNKSINNNIVLLIIVILNLIFCSISLNIPLYSSLLFLSVIFVILYTVINKLNLNNKNIFFYISLVAVSLASLFYINNNSIILICINVLTYSYIYYLLKKTNTPFLVNFIYTLVGFGLIYNLIYFIVSQVVVSNLIILLVYLIIITSMFLLEVDTDEHVLGYSIVTIVPYYNLICNIELLNNYTVEAMVLLLIGLVFLYFEKVFKFKNENDKYILEIILLSILNLFVISKSLLFNIIISVIYIFIGAYKKKNAFIILGIVFLLLVLLINLYNIVHNLFIIYILLLVGIMMIIYVFVSIINKEKNKK